MGHAVHSQLVPMAAFLPSTFGPRPYVTETVRMSAGFAPRDGRSAVDQALSPSVGRRRHRRGGLPLFLAPLRPLELQDGHWLLSAEPVGGAEVLDDASELFLFLAEQLFGVGVVESRRVEVWRRPKGRGVVIVGNVLEISGRRRSRRIRRRALR